MAIGEKRLQDKTELNSEYGTGKWELIDEEPSGVTGLKITRRNRHREISVYSVSAGFFLKSEVADQTVPGGW